MEPKEKGDWIKQRNLGNGGFGLVVLWKNKETQNALALKQCRCGHELTTKQSKRWQMEVDIMRKLDHPNVVKALDVPPELDVSPQETPVLAMEYCSKGDLRRVLNRPESCCGLPEITVRCLLQDISSAVKYLHSMRIIHRDLKPENIVLQDVDGKTVYKLIDLGYAKELDEGSLCESFVGTLQYLAPELFQSQKYSRTVDFWSLGLVAHECIVGFRPFLPTMTPAQWMPLVCKKNPSNICVYLNSEGGVSYSDNLFPENHLTRPFIESMEEWLRLMVEWDSKKRGMSCNSDEQDDVIAFSKLEHFLEEKIVSVFSAANGKTYSYKVNEDTSMKALLEWFANDSNSTVEDVEFILPRGLPPDMVRGAVQGWSPPEEDIDWLLYAYPKTEINTKQIQVRVDISLVQEMLKKKKVPTSYPDQRRMWAKAVHFVHLVRQMHVRLLQALKVLMMNLLVRCIPLLNKTSVLVVKSLDRLQAKLDFCQESMQNDKQFYEEQAQEGISHRKFPNSFQCEAFVKKLRELKARVSNEESTVNRVNAKMVELQRSPYAHPKQKHVEFDGFYKTALDTFQKLKEKPREQRSVPSDNTDMVRIIIECMKEQDTLLRPFFMHLEKVRSCKQEVSEAMKPLVECQDHISILEAELSDLQRQRQQIIWKSIKFLAGKLKKQKEKVGSPQSGEVSSTSNGPFSANMGNVAAGSFQSFTSTTSFTGADGSPLSISGILSQQSKASRCIMQESQECLSLMQDQMSSLNLPGNNMDWSFLETIKNNKT